MRTAFARTMAGTLLTVLAVLLIALGAANFLLVVADLVHLGGDAVHGSVQDGRYFVGGHGRQYEVTRDDWERSRSVHQSMGVTGPLTLVGAAYVLIAYGVPAIGWPGPGAARRVATVRASGPEIASAWCAGQIGLLGVRGPFMHVTAHPHGITVRPFFMPPRAVLTDEIFSLETKTGIFSHSLKLRHAAPDVACPIVLVLGEDGPLARAIRDLASNSA